MLNGNLIQELKSFIVDRNHRMEILAWKGFYNKMPDEEFLKKIYKAIMDEELNLDEPLKFSEKLQWLKLYNRNPEYTVMADKYLVRGFVEKKIGEKYLIPLIGVWKDARDINFEELPEQFVLKCNHNSGRGMCICKDKSKLNIRKVRKDLNKGLTEDYYLHGREWPYKDIPRRIVCEQYMTDSMGAEGLTDYKFFCFDGNADSVMVCLDRHTGNTKFYFFDKDWKLLKLNVRGKNAPENFAIPKPSCMDEMFKISAKLSEGIPFVRVDLYECNGRIYFGEMTFFPQSGFDSNLLPEAEEYYGRMIELN